MHRSHNFKKEKTTSTNTGTISYDIIRLRASPPSAITIHCNPTFANKWKKIEVQPPSPVEKLNEFSPLYSNARRFGPNKQCRMDMDYSKGDNVHLWIRDDIPGKAGWLSCTIRVPLPIRLVYTRKRPIRRGTYDPRLAGGKKGRRRVWLWK